jgi:hypothetical protein
MVLSIKRNRWHGTYSHFAGFVIRHQFVADSKSGSCQVLLKSRQAASAVDLIVRQNRWIVAC